MNKTTKCIRMSWAYGMSTSKLKRKYGARRVRVAIKGLLPTDFRGRVYL